MLRQKMSRTRFGIDDSSYNMDGLRLLARDEAERVEAFIGRKVMGVWGGSIERRGGRQRLLRDQYNALGKRNLVAIERVVNAKYQRGAAINCRHPFVEVLFSDITESGEILDLVASWACLCRQNCLGWVEPDRPNDTRRHLAG